MAEDREVATCLAVEVDSILGCWLQMKKGPAWGHGPVWRGTKALDTQAKGGGGLTVTAGLLTK